MIKDKNSPIVLQGLDLSKDAPPHISTLFVDLHLKNNCDDNKRQKSEALKIPFKAICRLEITNHSGQQYIGTGFFISPRCVITSGHCVFNNGEWMKSIVVVPGANGTSNKRPLGHMKSKKFKSVSGWTDRGDFDYDYGAIILSNNSLYDRVNYSFEFKDIENEKKLLNYGYSDEPGRRHEQWGDLGQLDKIEEFRLYYVNDTVKGNSGSPIMVRNGDKFVVVGVHSYGDCPNICVRANPKVIHNWKEWTQL